MEYLKIDGEFPRLSKSAVTLGKFDGIHRGHQKLVEKILEQKEKGLQTVLFSLGIGSQMIFTKEERCQLLEKAGVDVLIECPLDNRIRHMKAETFIKEILKMQLTDGVNGNEYGGFVLGGFGSKSDVDITAMAIQALAPYYTDDTVYTYINENSKKEVTKTVRQ